MPTRPTRTAFAGPARLARPALLIALWAAMSLPGSPAAAGSRKPTPEDWAGQLRHVTVNGADLAYLDVGKGEPVVLVHGSAADYRTWLGELQPLAQQYRVIAYSRRYHYPNTGGGNGRDYSIDLHERDLVALIAELNLGKVNLVGHSYGATLAAQLATHHPELVKSLVLIEPGLPDLMKGTPKDSLYESESSLVFARAQQSLLNDFPSLGLTAIAEWAMGDEALEAMPRFAKQQLAENAPALKLQILSPVKSTAPLGCEQLKRIACPVLYIEGQKSPWHHHATADAFIACRPSTPRVTLKGESHDMVWTDPRDVSKAVLEFLSRGGLASE